MSPRVDFHTTICNASNKRWQYAGSASGIRPSLSVKSGTMISKGNGGASKPYKLLEN